MTTEVILIYPTPEGSREIKLEGGRLSFGRGSEADLRFDDPGLSRLHATVYCEDGKIWIVDENSSNGTFVNNQRVTGAGTPLSDGDRIRIGHKTELRLMIKKLQPAVATTNEKAQGSGPTAAALPKKKLYFILPALLIALAMMIIAVSAVVIVVKIAIPADETSQLNSDEESSDSDYSEKKDKSSRTNDSTTKDSKNESENSDAKQPEDTKTSENELNSGQIPAQKTVPTGYTMPAGKKYLDLSEAERRQYVSDRAMRIAEIIGNSSSNPISQDAIEIIKGYVDGYAKRINVKPLSGCRFGDNLQATYERASRNAPFIIKAFNEKGIDPRVGLYLAMIESEHCVCLQSPTGPLGMFQFTYATAKLHFIPNDGIIKGASPSNPDDRCKPEPAAKAAASYMKALTGRYGTGPASVPLAIGSYNSGEGGLSANLEKALQTNSGLPREFWTLIEKADLLSKQFQAENFKYVPKFFAAAIVGENPQDFGLKLQPLSTYSQ
ncbi:MAG TPA: FHA domain-containing protein [Pyrinomonadaceae bacterium]|nr:FHA domain-containing protein [Pyrinomonadaceae bacterium]